MIRVQSVFNPWPRKFVASVIAIFTLVSWGPAQDSKYSIKMAQDGAPKELSDGVRKVLNRRSVQFCDPAGKTICEIWLRPEIPADATPEQIKNGITYREVKQTELFGAIRFEQDWTDYRKQKIKAGVYTLRLGYQPMDGDHQGASEFQEFLVLLEASKDQKPDTMDAKHMTEASAKSIGTGHPAVLMLFPVGKAPATPTLAALPKNHWVVNSGAEVVVAGKKTGASLSIGLTVVGAAE